MKRKCPQCNHCVPNTSASSWACIPSDVFRTSLLPSRYVHTGILPVGIFVTLLLPEQHTQLFFLDSNVLWDFEVSLHYLDSQCQKSRIFKN